MEGYIGDLVEKNYRVRSIQMALYADLWFFLLFYHLSEFMTWTASSSNILLLIVYGRQFSEALHSQNITVFVSCLVFS